MKRLRYQNGPLDPTDAAILRALAEDARTTMTDLSRSVGLSPPSVVERVRRMEEGGVIEGYRAVVNPAALGRPLTVFLRVKPVPGEFRRVSELIGRLSAIVECDRVTGEDCFIAKAHVTSVAELEALIDELMPYATTNTSLVQSSPVKRRLPPLNGSGGE